MLIGYINYITNCCALMIEYGMIIGLFMTRRTFSHKQFGGIIALFLGIGLLNQVGYQPMFYLVVAISLLNVIYKGSYKMCLLAWTVCIGIGVFIELLTYFVLGRCGLVGGYMADYLMYFSNIVLVALIVNLFKKTDLYFKDAKQYDKMTYIHLITVVAAMASLCLISIILGSGNVEKQYIFARKELRFILTYAVCSTIVLSILLIYKFKRSKANELVDLQRDYVSKHIERCNTLDDLELEKLHMQELINEHLEEVKRLAVQGKEKELHEALAKMLEINFSNKEEVETDQPIISAIINEKHQLACSKDIKMITSIGQFSTINMELVDLCFILTRSLDLAIELSEKLSSRYRKIKVECTKHRGETAIRIGFTIRECIKDNEMIINHIRLDEIEQNLQGIRNIINKYQGNLCTRQSNNWYELTISLK